MNRNAISPIILVVLTLISGFASAEDIKGYSDCDVCPGSIHYGPDETRTLLGKEGRAAIGHLKESDNISIDLDESLTMPFLQPPKESWAIRVRGNSLIIYIQDSLDESYVQIVTDYFRARQGLSMQAWNPEVFVQSGKADVIERDDSIDQAWNKVRESNIYYWVMDGNSGIAWEQALNNKLMQALGALDK